ncbi:excinuclease ABC subunit UvrC [Heyndrickxia acidiproducens]|uniref:excinuclease ABC subunit UvrC n=1 Tax=Heyndrickxia acidiproducens TaxID=1121084 RepID=UPI00035F4F37|nr:excinuclease ABC subunit UvrC [Heyndrickxia acidiproducens]
MNPVIQHKLSLLPGQPGCYLMKNRAGKVIYVGKAKKLKNRVRSYFTGSHDEKTAQLVREIFDLEWIVTDTNTEALVLEMNLIKKYRPKYNIMLKDDKSYPYIKITAERHPQLILTRESVRDKGKYFGPFPNVRAAAETKKLLDRLYPLRRCPESSTHACLYYQLGLCIGTCAREVSEEEYKEQIRKIVHFFHGGYRKVLKDMKKEMQDAAEQLDFEKAENLKEQMAQLELTMEQQNVALNDHISRDIFGYAAGNGWMCVQTFYLRQGKIMEREISFKQTGSKDPDAAFLEFLQYYYGSSQTALPKEILIPDTVGKETAKQLLYIRVVQPKRGQKKEMVHLANKNAQIALEEKFSLLELKTC